MREPLLPQHKPKSTKLKFESEPPSYSSVIEDHGVVQESRDFQEVQIESKRSFVFSLLLRTAGLCVGSAMSIFFLSHYVAADITALRNFSLSSATSWFLVGALALGISRIYANSVKDQTLSIDELKAQSSKVISKPLFSYLGWTFCFFVFAFISHTWLRWPAAWFIFNAGANLKFRKSGFLNLTSWPAGAARFSSIRIKR